MSRTIEELKKDKKSIEVIIERILRDFQKKYNINISGIDVYNDSVFYSDTNPSFVTEVKINVTF